MVVKLQLIFHMGLDRAGNQNAVGLGGLAQASSHLDGGTK